MIDRRLLRLLSHSGRYVLYQVLWQWIALVMQILSVYVIVHAVEGAYRGTQPFQELWWLLPFFGCMAGVRFLCDRMAANASYQAGADVKQTLRSRIYEKLLQLGSSYREQISTSEVVQLCTEGVEQLEIYFGKYLSQLLYSVLAPITLFCVLRQISLRAALVFLVCVPLIPVSIVLVQKLAKRLLNKYWDIYAGLGDSFLENLQGMTTLKIYQADGRKAEEMDREADRFRRITMKVLTMQLNSTSVMDIVAYGGAAAGMITAIDSYLHGRISFSGTWMIILLAAEFFIPLRQLGSYFHIAMNGMAASDKIFRLMDLPVPKNGQKTLKTGETISLKMRNVHFSYEADREILKGIDLEIPMGSFVSIAGESGCGKSTIASLLAGRHRSYQGDILVNGHSLLEMDEGDWRKHVTVVGHNAYLFAGTVRDNLAMASDTASEEEMCQYLQLTGLWGFLRDRGGLDMILSENADNLSGGQRQRLALARALLYDSDIYIFDEATSNVDIESEEQIMQVIRSLAGIKTVILISHRLANVTGSDMIYMMQEGLLVEAGDHETLLNKMGSYSSLYRKQEALENYGKKEVAQ